MAGPLKAGGAGFNNVRPITPYGGITVDSAGNRNLNRGGNTNEQATEGAKNYRDKLGLPSFQDVLSGKYGGSGSKEFGNAGQATAGADFAKKELGGWKANLGGDRSRLQKLRGDIANPTGTQGFKDVMSLATERAGRATEATRQDEAEAASRRGYVGGYNPESTERARLEAIAGAGGEAVLNERKSLQDQFGREGDVYRSDVAGYGQGLGAYTELTKTAAELPTKWLDAYSNLLGGAGGFGDIFRTSSQNVMHDTENYRTDADRRNAAVARVGGSGGSVSRSRAQR